MRAWSSYSIKEVSSSRKHERAYHQKRSCTISYKIHSSSKHIYMAFGCTILRGLKGIFNFDSKGLCVWKPILGIRTTSHKMQARENQHHNAIGNTRDYATCLTCGIHILHIYTAQLPVYTCRHSCMGRTSNIKSPFSHT